MGFPENNLTNSYLFPWYNTVHISTQMSFANVGTANTIVTVKIAGVVRGTYALAPNQSNRVKLVGINSGPVEVYSSGGVPIIASQRVAYSPDGGATWPSYTELMGMPRNQMTDTYYYPWYNTVNTSKQVSFANVGTSNTTVTVKIGGVTQGTYVSGSQPKPEGEVVWHEQWTSGGEEFRWSANHHLGTGSLQSGWRGNLDEICRNAGAACGTVE